MIFLAGVQKQISYLLKYINANAWAGVDFITQIATDTAATIAKVPDAASYTPALASYLNALTPQASKAYEYSTPGSYNFVVPANVTAIWATVVGAGASGGRGSTTEGGGGGGAGLTITNTVVLVTPGTTMTVSVGTGGAAATSNQTPGTNGTSSSFGGITAGGGQASGTYYAGGNVVPSDLAGTRYTNGTATTRSIVQNPSVLNTMFVGGPGGYGQVTNTGQSSVGGPCGRFAGGGRYNGGANASGGGGSSYFAQGGSASVAAAGGAGSMGSGGSGSPSGYNSGPGGNGYVLLEMIG